jgi:DnaK suppressor protein
VTFDPDPARPAARRSARTDPEEVIVMRTEETRARLEQERERLTVARDALRLHAGPTGGAQREDTGELSGMDEHVADVASDTLEREVDLAVLHSLDAAVAAIDAALDRLAAGCYGRCEVCGGPIGEARLRALPQATRCLRDQNAAEVADAALRDGLLHSASEMEAVAHLDLLPVEDPRPTLPPAEEGAMHVVP